MAWPHVAPSLPHRRILADDMSPIVWKGSMKELRTWDHQCHLWQRKEKPAAWPHVALTGFYMVTCLPFWTLSLFYLCINSKPIRLVVIEDQN